MVIGTCETQGLRETMTLLCGLLGSSVSVGPIPCPALGSSVSVGPIPCPALGSSVSVGPIPCPALGSSVSVGPIPCPALGSSVSVRPIPCPALCQILQPSLPHKNITFSPVGHARLLIWLRQLTAKRVNNQGENVHMSNSTTPIV